MLSCSSLMIQSRRGKTHNCNSYFLNFSHLVPKLATKVYSVTNPRIPEVKNPMCANTTIDQKWQPAIKRSQLLPRGGERGTASDKNKKF